MSTRNNQKSGMVEKQHKRTQERFERLHVGRSAKNEYFKVNKKNKGE